MSAETPKPPEPEHLVLSRAHRAAIVFISPEKARYSLTALHYNAARQRIEATDGHAALCLPLEVDGAAFLPKKDLLIPSAALSAIEGAMSDVNTQVTVTPLEEKAIRISADVAAGPISILASQTEGRFPDVSAVLPAEKEKPAFSITIASDQLLRLAKYAGEHGLKNCGTTSIRFDFYKKDLAAKFSFCLKDGSEAFGLQMPVVKA